MWPEMEETSADELTVPEDDVHEEPVQDGTVDDARRRSRARLRAELPQLTRDPVELRASFVVRLPHPSLSSQWPLLALMPMRVPPGSHRRVVRGSTSGSDAPSLILRACRGQPYRCNLDSCNHVDFVMRMIEVDILVKFMATVTDAPDSERSQIAQFLAHSLVQSGVICVAASLQSA